MAPSVGFGEFRFQLDSGQLWLRGDEVRLTPKAAEVLKALVVHAGSPVSKADLFATVWPDVAVTDDEALAAFHKLCRLEGIIPALESCHALAYAAKIAPRMKKEQLLLVNLSGRGDKDMHTVAQQSGIQI